MKKLLGILVLGLLWCNTSFAEKTFLICKEKNKDRIDTYSFDTENIYSGAAKYRIITNNDIIYGIFENDPNTKAVLLVSKPVDDNIRNKIINKINNFSKKNYVLCLVGDNENREDSARIKFSKSIQTSVLKILKSLDDNVYKKANDAVRNQVNDSIKLAESLSKDLNDEQKFVRGFFAGGTLCYESKIILEYDVFWTVFQYIPSHL